MNEGTKTDMKAAYAADAQRAADHIAAKLESAAEGIRSLSATYPFRTPASLTAAIVKELMNSQAQAAAYVTDLLSATASLTLLDAKS